MPVRVSHPAAGLEERTMSTDQLIALLVLVIMIVQLAVKKGKS
ncbi:hypothetical protein PAECIP111892_05059 [Paenibacillus auburnensis]|uniref:Holin-like toxin n=1 Tax=Paenibacillus auburnensis TaxID=2905649 RepID=A0ABN8GY34_9BACL|nr:hypothetical protein PAECIP111892_05059 [Paenibacillus auburnensis]